ncbi:choice-of-anchor B family protein [Kangiella geojedonensis]|uniref:Na-Ca exchanger/integrin-beta4 n=1 Tax=Kangiella geojedonensis TaxID=914150 RepID=A0A0F6TP02_9GAMM|nr:choice-of-anchor B family protein [Kangiella geojedonensis]AKE51164.1 Na-Ca exchanger/integrin-beta4 [Kangiella geojedonensis]
MKKALSLGLLALSTTMVSTEPASAHSGAHPVRYVAVDGVDQGNCSSPSEPCASISYAVNESSKGDKIYVASGKYFAEAMDIFYLLNDMVAVKGGFSRDNGYKKQAPEKHITTIVGLPAEYRDKLTEKGFRLLQDTKGNQEFRVKPEYLDMLDRYQKVNSTNKKQITCDNGSADEFPCYQIDLVSQLSLASLSTSPSSASDIWGYVDLNNNREYALLAVVNGTTLIDVTDAENPSEVGTVSGVNSTWRDVKVYQYLDNASGNYKAYAYVTTEGQGGLQVIDLSDAPNSISLVNTIDVFQTAHNVYLGNIDYTNGTALDGHEPYLYIAGSNLGNGSYRVFDLVDPENPALVTTPSSTGYVHDATNMIIDDSRTSQCAAGHNPCELFIDFNENTVDIWDTTDKSSPLRISSTPYNGASYTHSGWYSKDKNYVFIQDELDERNLNVNTRLYVMDISDLTSPQIVGRYEGQTRAIDHNGFTLGDKYYMSNYKRGLTVLDVADPTQPKEIGFFDTYPIPQANDPQFDGAWGTFPYLPSGNILVSDISNGLFVLKDNSNIGDDGPGSSQPDTPTTPPEEDTGSGGGGGPVQLLTLLLLGGLLGRRRIARKQR